jgi:hypothetical protein
MRRITATRAVKKQATVQLQEHWRAVALREFPEHRELVLSDDEEYGIYNFLFRLRGEFTEAIASGDAPTASRILGFAGRCLGGELASDGEDIGAAAGVSLFEHVFEDMPRKRWSTVFSIMPHSVYLAGRHYAEQWLEAETFSELDRDAKDFYG